MNEIEGQWKKEFQYLLDRKILTRDELAYLFGQIKSIISTLEEKVKELREQSNSIAKIASDYSLKIAILEETIKQFEGRINELENAINNTGCLVLKNSIGKSKEVETDLQDYRERNPLVEQLSERIKELEEKIKEVVRGNFKQICSYCGWECPPSNGWEELQEHIKVCEKHPLRQSEARVKELEKLNNERLNLILEPCDFFFKLCEWVSKHKGNEEDEKQPAK